MSTAAIIVAAGRGQRVGGDIAKQWRDLAGMRVADRTLNQFRDASDIDLIVLVLPVDDDLEWMRYNNISDLILAKGGTDRAGSVRNGLIALQGMNVDKVLIHDVARPCVSSDLIAAIITTLDVSQAAAPALPITDALWTGAVGFVTGAQDRRGLFGAQTPQGFHYNEIVAAHTAHPGGAADDVEVARAAGLDIAIIPGDTDNIKITTEGDFARAERILRGHMDIRLGNGFDVHRFGPGDYVTLCGIEVPHERGLQGHSDADVAMHALTDALYGALAQGDIGQHFPPSDPQWKGAASEIFLRHAVKLAASMGFRVSNSDVTLICEFPKVGPHALVMRQSLADIMGVRLDQVSVKATTSERLGFTGRGEGIAALATATLVTL